MCNGMVVVVVLFCSSYLSTMLHTHIRAFALLSLIGLQASGSFTPRQFQLSDKIECVTCMF